MTTSIHITLTECVNETRLFKHVDSTVRLGLVKKAYVLARQRSSKRRLERRGPLLIIRSRVADYRTPILVRKVYQQVMFVLLVISTVRRLRPRYLVIHSYSLLQVGVLSSRLVGAKLIYDAHELETEKTGLTGYKKRFAKIVEFCLIRYCDEVLVVSESIRSWYEQKYHRKVRCIHNFPDIPLGPKTNYFRDYFEIKKETRIALYQGGFSNGRGITSVLDLFLHNPPPGWIVVFMGYGELAQKIREAADKSPYIYFHNSVDPSVLPAITSSGDMGLCLIEEASLSYEYCMPNKLFEYICAGIPVLVSCRKDMSDFVRRNNCGWALESDSEEQLRSFFQNYDSDHKSKVSDLTDVALMCDWSVYDDDFESIYQAGSAR